MRLDLKLATDLSAAERDALKDLSAAVYPPEVLAASPGRFLEWAAADLGASPRQAIRHIVLPLIAPAILAGALICVTLSVDEFIITWFTVGPQPTLPTYIYTQTRFGVTPEVNAVATVMLLATLLIFGIASVVLRRARRLPGRRRREA